jgi:hypothetical protein
MNRLSIIVTGVRPTSAVLVLLPVFFASWTYADSLLHICHFPDLAAAAFMYNNCKALRAGKYSYDHLNQPALLGPAARPRPPAQTQQGQSQGQKGAAAGKGTGELSVVGTRSGYSEGAILNIAVGLSS